MRHEARVRQAVGQRRIRLFELQTFAIVSKPTAPRTEDGHRWAEGVGGAEAGERCGIGRGIEAHHQQAFVGGEGNAGREFEIHRVAQTPGVCGMSRIRERNCAGRDVMQLDELGQIVFVGATGRHHFRRVIHDFTDDDRADESIRVRRTRAATEVHHTRRAVLAKRALPQRGEILTDAGEVTTNGNPLLCRAEAGFGAIAREHAGAGRRREIHLIATR